MSIRGRKLVLVLVILSSVLGMAQPQIVHGTSAAQTACDLDAIVADVGQYHYLTGAETAPQVFLMQDHHGLVSGRIESAVMMHRLARDCGLTMLGMEGVWPEEQIALDWVSGLPVHVNHATAVTLLAEGEINQGELIIVTHHNPYELNVAHIGIDDRKHYEESEPADDPFAGDTAMYYTAVGQIFQDAEALAALIAHLNEEPEDQDSAEYDEWEEVLFELIYDKNPHPDIQRWSGLAFPELDDCLSMGVPALLELNTLTTQIVRDLRADTDELLDTLFTQDDDPERPDLDALLEQVEEDSVFLEHTRARDTTMLQQVGDWLAAHPDGQIMVLIGAAHTAWLEEQLENQGYSTIALSPVGLCDDSQAVALTDAEYEQKNSQQSLDNVDGAGAGAYIDIIPRSFLAQPAGQVKLTLYDIVLLITEGLRRNPDATLASILDGVTLRSGITVDMDSLAEVAPGRYTVAVDINVQDINLERMYLGIATDIRDTEPSELDLETMLLMKREQVLQMGTRQKTGPDLITQIAPHVVGAFSPQQSVAVQAIRNAS